MDAKYKTTLEPNSIEYSASQRHCVDHEHPPAITALGNLDLLDRTLEFQLTILPYLNNLFVRRAMMIVKITSKRQVTFPARVLDALGVGPGDQIELKEGPEGFILKPRRIDYSRLGYLKDKIDPGIEPFDIDKFRSEPYDPSLRD